MIFGSSARRIIFGPLTHGLGGRNLFAVWVDGGRSFRPSGQGAGDFVFLGAQPNFVAACMEPPLSIPNPLRL